MSDSQIEATFSHSGNSQSTNQNKNKLVQTGEQHRGAFIASMVVIILLMGVGARMISLHFKRQRN